MKIKVGTGISVEIRSDETISGLILICLGILQLIKYFAIIPVVMANALVVALGGVSLLLVLFRKGFKGANQRPIVFILVYSLCGVLGYLYNSNMDAVELLWPVGYMFLGIFFLNYGIPLKVSKLVYYGVAGVFFAEIIINGSVNNLTASFSRNIISVYLLMFFSLMIISCYQHNEKISFLPPLLFFVVCFAAVGRGGALLGAIALILFMLFDFSKGRAKKRNVIGLPVLLTVLGVVALIMMQVAPDLIETVLDNFESRGVRSQRYNIWEDYIEKAFGSLTNLLFGASISGTIYLDRYSENLHNSFLMLHAKYGILMLSAVIIMLIQSFRKFLRHRNYSCIVVFLLMFFRMNLDYTNFNDCLDVIMIVILFCDYYPAINGEQQERREITNTI